MPRVVAEPDRAAALELLWAPLTPPLRKGFIDAAIAESQAYGPDYWSGLVACRQGDALAGVAWAQPHAGRVALFHGPAATIDRPALAESLARFGVEQAAALDLTCLQALLPTETTPQAAALTAAGFGHVADLLYLYCSVEAGFDRPIEPTLRFRTGAHAELKSIIEQTYLGSLDCPALDGLRAMEDILAGYRAIGNYRPEHWQVVSVGTGEAARDVGCLILADHPGADQIELVYMGVIAEERGRGWGAHLVRQAQGIAHALERKRLVLAVDAANAPAVRMYAAEGLITFDRRSAWHLSLDDRGKRCSPNPSRR